GIRQALDAILHRHGLLDELELALEIGGWAPILGHRRGGFGGGGVSGAGLGGPADPLVRRLAPPGVSPTAAERSCPPRAGRGEGLDLSEAALAWWRLLQAAAT